MGKKFSFDFIPFTTDQIKEMSLPELSLNLSKFKRFIKEALNSGADTRLFETEFCYLDHERQTRARADDRAHRLKNNLSWRI